MTDSTEHTDDTFGPAERPPAPDGVGLFEHVPDEVYHSDLNSLSSSGARLLVTPSNPALFVYAQTHKVYKRAYDLGHAVHLFVLGEGATISVVNADDWKTKAAREKRDRAYALGLTPLLPHEYAKAKTMANAVLGHPLGRVLFAEGQAEASLYWTDTETGIRCRARPDFIPARSFGGRRLFVDLKTTKDSNPAKFARSVADYGYHVQQVWYTDGAREIGLDDNCGFVFVNVDVEPPHLVSVVQLDAEAIEIGGDIKRRALRTYARCAETGVWPGWSDDITTISLPNWATYNYEMLGE